MKLTFWLQILVNGLLLGGIYSLSALAFSLEWGVLNIINLAHGSFIMLGAYSTWLLLKYAHLDPFESVPVLVVVFFFVGYGVQRWLINRIIRASMFLTLLVTFGLDFILVNSALLLWTGDYRSVTTTYSESSLVVAGVSIPLIKLGVLVLALFLSIGLSLLIGRTKLGRSIMATSMDLDAARMMGIRIPVTYAITMGIGTAFTAVAGAMTAVTYAFTPNIGGSFTMKAFVVTIIGGLGNMYGPLWGGLLLGVVEAFGAVLLGPGYTDAISFIILVIVLVLRPHGLLGKEAQA